MYQKGPQSFACSAFEVGNQPHAASSAAARAGKLLCFAWHCFALTFGLFFAEKFQQHVEGDRRRTAYGARSCNCPRGPRRRVQLPTLALGCDALSASGLCPLEVLTITRAPGARIYLGGAGPDKPCQFVQKAFYAQAAGADAVRFALTCFTLCQVSAPRQLARFQRRPGRVRYSCIWRSHQTTLRIARLPSILDFTSRYDFRCHSQAEQAVGGADVRGYIFQTRALPGRGEAAWHVVRCRQKGSEGRSVDMRVCFRHRCWW